LPFVGDGPARHAWGVWGPDDSLGTLNAITPDTVRAATNSIRTGERFNLCLAVDEPSPPLFGRGALVHEAFELGTPLVYDDRLDNFFPQGSTQWDALRHIGHANGFYNGRPRSDGDGEFGIGNVATAGGIVGRGVLVDIPRHAARTQTPFDARSAEFIDAAMLQAALDSQGSELSSGDILCLRTGWMQWYRTLDATERARLSDHSSSPEFASVGLEPAVATVEFLWDSGISALAADNAAVERLPPTDDPFSNGLHVQLLALLGLTLGELFDFESVAEDCAAAGSWDFFFAAAPLNIRAGVGSPGNAVAIR
jgi:kynurenine formamidase